MLSNYHRSARHLAGLACSVSLAVLSLSPAMAQDVPDQTATEDKEQTADENGVIVVTGFRQSLEAALNLKRTSVSSIDAIIAEDIAKFPDLNLAESLQRIPGISIQRDGGEGRSITVRGLGSQFTRVRLNGLETIATTVDGGSVNRERGFDFNVFASELFSSLVVHKTAEASLDEGSLGAVVDLSTGNPLGGKAGFTGALAAQASYNDQSEKVGPRLAGLLSWRNDAGTFGASVSAAYSKVKLSELGNNSVRWGQASFNSVNGTPCYFSTPAETGGTPVNFSGSNYRPSAACDAAALSFHPRIPRYAESLRERERLGLTGSIQFEPTESTRISIDGLYSRYIERKDDRTAEILARSNERFIDVVNPVYDSNNNMISATWNNAYVRTEHYFRKFENEFYQIGGSLDQDFGDRFRVTLIGGISKSNADIPIETTIMFDDRDAQNYSYDYTDMKLPRLTFGSDVTSPSSFQLAEIRDAPSNQTNRFKTAQMRAEWDVTDDFQIKAGAAWRRYNFDLFGADRNATVCGNGGLDRVLGTLTCSPTSLFGPTAVNGFPVTAALSETWTMPNIGQPAGTTNTFLVANLAATTAFTRLYERPLVTQSGNVRGVQETSHGAYIQFDGKGELLGVEYALNAGIRYVKTDQSSYGINNGQLVSVSRSYEDWLPAFNLAVFPVEELILRAAVADVMTRPDLGLLTPGGSASGFTQNVNFGNPFLDPTRATAYDLALEWYFRPESVFSVAFFTKSISSFPVAAINTGTFLSTGLPASVFGASDPATINPALLSQPIWNISTTVNGTGAKLKGMEVSLQMPFWFLPGALSNFGIQANATLVDSSATFRVTGPAVNACRRATATSACALSAVAANYRSTLFDLSKRAFNATLYYDDGKFSARSSLTYRSPFITSTSGNNNVFEGYGAQWNLDASIRYKLTDNIEFSLEGTNLTNASRYRFVDQTARRNYEYNLFGRTILVGARLTL